MPTERKNTPARQAQIVAYLSQGYTQRQAAACCGISLQTLKNWLVADASFRERVYRGKFEYVGRAYQVLKDRIDENDLKAAIYLLTRMDEDEIDGSEASIVTGLRKLGEVIKWRDERPQLQVKDGQSSTTGSPAGS